MTWSLYIIKCSKGTLYTGVTTDINRRFKQHQGKDSTDKDSTLGSKGARYLRGRAPLTLVYCEPIGDKSLALKVEHAVKRLSKLNKVQLIGGHLKLDSLIASVLSQDSF